jgi:polyhydroxyalkanoate synthesis regulator phasin
MKKISMLIIAFSMIFLAPLYAEDSANLTDVDQNFPKPLPNVKAASKETLTSFDEASYRTRLNNLEQRIRDLEQDLRFQDEKIDSLERTVDDMRRRHLR